MVTHIALKKFGVKYNKEFKIAGIHKMKKAELIKAIEDKLIKSRKEIKDEYKQLKNMVKVKKGFHKMPNGSIMANSDMPKNKPLENIQIKIDVKNRKIKAMKYLNEYNKTIYQTLKPYGITSEAKAKKMTREELKKIYRKILLEKHPDKTGDSSQSFNRYKTAIQILMDTIK